MDGMTMFDESMFLFAMPRWSMGMGRLLDLGGTADEYNESITPSQADAIATWLDWSAVGGDIRIALTQAKNGEAA